MSDPLLSIRGLRAAYGDVQALDGVSLDIADNEFFALLGPSGCGKTTLLRTLAGFETPTEGTVTLAGEDLLTLPPHRRPVNMMFQSYALFPHLSVERNVGYGPARAGAPRAQIAQRVAEVLETVGLSGVAGRRPHELSGGQRQRVALARAIVNRPRVLLLDEPLSALDKRVRSQMQLELKRLQHEVGIAFVMVTHDQEEALSMADRIAVLDGGRIQQIATPEQLYRWPENRFVAEFIGESNLFSAADFDVDGSYVVVRPESVRLVEGAGLLRATVLETQFVGGTTTLVAEPRGPVTVSRAPVLVRHGGFPAVERGAEVGLAWDASDMVVLR